MNYDKATSLLGLSSSSQATPYTKQDIRRAYKTLAKTLHPDKNGMAEEFIQLKEAHDYLMSLVDSSGCIPSSSSKSTNTSNTSNATMMATVKEMEELISLVMKQYREAVVPFVLALPPNKQAWVVDFLEMYGELLFGDTIQDILTSIRESVLFVSPSPSVDMDMENEANDKDRTQDPSDSPDSPPYHVHIHEMLMDQIIVHKTIMAYAYTDEKGEQDEREDKEDHEDYIPSWTLVHNGHAMIRHSPSSLLLQDDNTLVCHIRIPLTRIFHSTETIIPLNASYFSTLRAKTSKDSKDRADKAKRLGLFSLSPTARHNPKTSTSCQQQKHAKHTNSEAQEAQETFMIHVIGSVYKHDLRMTPEIQYMDSVHASRPMNTNTKVFEFFIYNEKGDMICSRKGSEGIYQPSESMVEPIMRAPCIWGIQLVL